MRVAKAMASGGRDEAAGVPFVPMVGPFEAILEVI
jgi:hypothetical protein